MSIATKAASSFTEVVGTWVDETNAYSTTGDNAYCTHTQSARNGTAQIRWGFPSFTTSDIPDGSTINSVKVSAEVKLSNTISSFIDIAIQNPSGTDVGSATQTSNTTDTLIESSASTVPSLQNLRDGTVYADMLYDRANSNQSETVSIDYVSITVDYTESIAGSTISPTAIASGEAFGSVTVVLGAPPPSTIAPTAIGELATGNAYLVVADKTALATLDSSVKSQLEGLGWTITLMSDEDTEPSMTGYGLVVIAESVASATLGTKYRNIAVPLLLLSDGAVVPSLDFGSANENSATNETDVSVSDATHPAADGQTGTVTILTAGSLIRGNQLSNLGAGASVYLKKVTDSNFAYAYSYDSGAAMLNSHTAEARRLFLGFFHTAQDGAHNTAAWGFFDAAVAWLVPAAPGGFGTPTVSVGSSSGLTVSPTAIGGTFAVSYADTILADTPIAYWRLGEASGTFYDSSGNGHDSTAISGTITYGETGALTGDSNTAASGTAVTGRIGIAHHEDFNFGDGPFSIELWVKRAATGVIHWYIGKWDNGGWAIGNSASGQLTAYRYPDYFFASSETPLNDTNWHHVVVTKNGAARTAYVDGVALTNTMSNVTLSDTTLDIWLFGGNETAGGKLNGALDEVAIYGSVLSAAQVVQHYEAGKATLSYYESVVLTDSPVAHWRLGEPSGTTVNDNIGAVDGSYVNSPTLGVAGALANDSDTAVTFNGTNQRALISDHASLDVGDSLTLEFWLKTTTPYKTIMSRGGASYWCWVTATGTIEFFGTAITAPALYTSVAVDDGNWHHVVVTKDGSTRKCYVDGSDVTVLGTNLTLVDNDLAFAIGSNNGGTDWFAGSLDEVALYDHALSAAQVVAHYSASAHSSFGTPTVTIGTVTLTISPTAVDSVEQFGAALISAPATQQSIQPAAISSAEAFGTASILRGGVVVAPTGIATSETFGTATILRGTRTLVVTAITTSESVSSPTLLKGTARVLPTGITTAEAFGTATLLRGGVTISVSSVTSAEAIGTAVVASGVPPALMITPNAIASAEAFGTSTLLRGGVSIQPTAIASTEAVGSPAIRASAKILPTAIASAQALGTPTLVVGGVAIRPSAITSTEAFGTTYVNAGQMLFAPVGIASVEIFGTATVRPGGRTISVTGLATAQAFGTPVLLRTRTLTVTGIASTEQFGVPVVIRGAVAIVPQGATTGEALGTPTIVSGAGLIVPTGVPTSETFGNHTVEIGTVPGTAVEPVAISSTETFGLPVVRAGMVRAIVTGIGTAAVIPNPVLYGNKDLSVIGITSAELFGLAVLAKGPAYVRPTGIESTEAMGLPALANLLDSWLWVNRSPGFIDTRTGGYPVLQSGLYGTRRQEGEG